jgi:hypothetical protein
LILGDHFRDGNVSANKQPLDIVREAYDALPADVERRRFRGDGAYYETQTVRWLSDQRNRIERFTVSTPIDPQLRKRCQQISASTWKLYEQRPNETLYLSELEHTGLDLPKETPALRLLVIKIERDQCELFDGGDPTKYLAVLSNDFQMDAAKLLRWHHKKAGSIERVHAVVKNQLGGGIMPCGAFGANAAWWRLSLMTYNVLSALKRLGLSPRFETAEPKRLRFAILNLPGRVLSHARRIIVRVAEWLTEHAELVDARHALYKVSWLPLPSR